MKIILATHNQDKVNEIKKILKIKGVAVLSLDDFPVKLKTREDGRTFEENAVKKAKAAAKKFNMVAIADDSGLCVDALYGAPGVRSARFVSPPVTSAGLCEKLLLVMSKTSAGKRKAHFVCTVAIVWPDGHIKISEGRVNGSIINEMRGSGGFGYDPVFVPDGYSKTFAELSTPQKNRISHRGRAFKKAAKYLAP
jgi:XTP/dITP diphosphohydrolase